MTYIDCIWQQEQEQEQEQGQGFDVFSLRFIDCMAVLGQAYDLRKASPATVAARAMRTGDIALTRRGATPLGATPLGATKQE